MYSFKFVENDSYSRIETPESVSGAESSAVSQLRLSLTCSMIECDTAGQDTVRVHSDVPIKQDWGHPSYQNSNSDYICLF